MLERTSEAPFLEKAMPLPAMGNTKPVPGFTAVPELLFIVEL